MTETVLRSPAKLNLSLRVFRPRPDGYHPIYSIFHEIDLHDTLTVATRPGGGHLQLSCNWPEVPVDSRNLVAKAVAVFAPWNTLDISIDIEKRIPVGGGLGGGSSNAGVVLRWLNDTLGRPLSEGQLRAEALKLGADVCFFLSGGTALVSGIGEVIVPITLPQHDHYVLVIPPISILSGEIYKTFDEIYPDADVAPDIPTEWPEMGINDLKQAVWVMHPQMYRIETELETTGLGPVVLSGSGSTLFIRCLDEVSAIQTAALVRDCVPECKVLVTK